MATTIAEKIRVQRLFRLAWIACGSLSVLCSGTAFSASATPPTAKPPNILLILVDDLGYGGVGCYGATKVRTPNIDRLASQGRLFTDAHASSAACTPSRYGLLTGQYAWRINNWAPIFWDAGLIVDTHQLTVPRLLKQHGYATACFGKWHLGFGEKQPDWNGDLKPGPLEVGFDYYYGVPVVSSNGPFVYVENHRVVGLDPADPLVPGTEPSTPYPEKNLKGLAGAKVAHALYKDDEIATNLTTRSTRWLREHKDGPFFLYLATTNIHDPFTPAARFKGTSDCGIYGDFIHELDWSVGEVLKTLDELSLADNTLVILTSDNGGMLNLGGKAAWDAGHRLNGNLLGFKFGAWEGGHRIPYIARWPGHIAPASRSSQLISLVDTLATVAALVDQNLKPEDGPDSFNILPALLGDPPPIRNDAILAAEETGRLALRSGRWVYVMGRGSGGFDNGLKELAYTHEVNTDITPDGKIKPDAPPAQLYDLEADPSQRTNVYRENPQIVKEMQERLEKYRADGRTAPVQGKK